MDTDEYEIEKELLWMKTGEENLHVIRETSYDLVIIRRSKLFRNFEVHWRFHYC